MILQRYYFESNSQPRTAYRLLKKVVTDIAKILFWKQFTTWQCNFRRTRWLSLILQRYYFESNSQLLRCDYIRQPSCHWYCKDTILKAIHNNNTTAPCIRWVVTDIAKILFWKQFTTFIILPNSVLGLSLILQRYYFESNSQRNSTRQVCRLRCHWYCKDTILKAIHNSM